MIATKSVPRLRAEEHPENRPSAAEEISDGNFRTRPISFTRGLIGMWLAAAVGMVLTILVVAYPLGAGDTLAALCMTPLLIFLVAIATGWIAANLFLEDGLKPRGKA
jgi:ABC-type Fe3+ transport system permease subunit